MKTKTYIIPDKTGSEYYNMGDLLSLNANMNESDLKLQDVIGHNHQARMLRLKTYIRGIPHYKYIPHQRNVIELLIEGYIPVDISEKLDLSTQYVSICITNFRKYAKKYLTYLRESGIV